jgi:hypothetical protein
MYCFIGVAVQSSRFGWLGENSGGVVVLDNTIELYSSCTHTHYSETLWNLIKLKIETWKIGNLIVHTFPYYNP